MTHPIKRPQSFDDLCMWFAREIDHAFPEHNDDRIGFALTHMDARQKEEIRTFLSEALDGRYSAEQLQDIWNRSPSRYYIPDDAHLRAFLGEIVRNIELNPKSGLPEW